MVLNLDMDLGSPPFNVNPDRRTARMTMDVGQAFLHDPVNRDLHFAGKPAEFVVDLQTGFNSTALRESIRQLSDRAATKPISSNRGGWSR